MSNSSSVTILEDSAKHASAKIVGVLDSSDVTLTGIVAKTHFSAKSPRLGAFSGFEVDKIQFAVSEGLVVTVAWDSATPQVIAALSGSGVLDFTEYGGVRANALAAGYTGDINLTTNGFVPGSTMAYTVDLVMRKQY